MSVAVHQENNIGSVFVFEVLDETGAPVDLSTATTLEARFKPSPDLPTFLRTGVLETTGLDGRFIYVSILGDLTPAGGCWQKQGRVVVPGLGEFFTFTREFPVKANL